MAARNTTKDFSILMLQSAHGYVRVMVSKKGIARLEFCPKKSTFKNSAAREEIIPKSWIYEIRNRLEGKASSLRLPLDMHGTDFQRLVWRALCRIPRGEVRSYADIAKSIGRPRAIRAVANACGSNRIGVLIPCHRVVRKNGKLGGYFWGQRMKQRLLEREGVLLPLNSA